MCKYSINIPGESTRLCLKWKQDKTVAWKQYTFYLGDKICGKVSKGKRDKGWVAVSFLEERTFHLYPSRQFATRFDASWFILMDSGYLLDRDPTITDPKLRIFNATQEAKRKVLEEHTKVMIDSLKSLL